jgi:uncharacterized protein YciI
VIRDGRRREKRGELEPAMAVRPAHHGNLDALVAQSSDTSGPFSFNRGPPFELEAGFAKEINRRCEVIDDDPYVVHPVNRHMCTLQGTFILTKLRGLTVEKPCDYKTATHEHASYDYAVTRSRILELAKNAHSLFIQENSHDQARLLKTLLSNYAFDRGSLLATYRKPFDRLVEGNENGIGCPPGFGQHYKSFPLPISGLELNPRRRK